MRFPAILLVPLVGLLACSGDDDAVASRQPDASAGAAGSSAGAGGVAGAGGAAGQGGAGESGASGQSGEGGGGGAGEGGGAGQGGAGGEAGQGGESGASGQAGHEHGGGGQGGEAGCPQVAETGTLSEEEAPLSLAVDATHIYWTSAEPDGSGGYIHEIRRAAKGGGEAETLVTAGGVVGAVALTEDSVVWVEVPTDGVGPSLLRKAPKAGGAPKKIASFAAIDGQPDVFSLQVNATDAFVMIRQFGSDFRYSIRRVPLSGAKGAEIAFHLLPAGIDARSMLLDQQGLYWSFLSGWVYRAPIDAAPAQEASLLVDTIDGVDGWALRGDEVIYMSAGTIWKMPKSGGDKAALLSGAEGYRALAASSDWLAWGARDHTGAEQIRARKGDGEVCVMATEGVVSAYSSVIDGDRFYWTNTASKAAGGAVRWVRLP